MKKSLGVLVLAAASLAAPRLALAQCSAANDPGACALVAGPLRFDRCFGSLPPGNPTPFGNSACDTLKTSNQLANNLGKNATKFVNDTKRDMDDFVKVTTDGAINKEAAQKFVAARNAANDVLNEGKALVNHPKCGTNGTIKGFQQFFATTGQNLVQAGQIAGKTVQAGSEAAKALPEVGAALAELAQLAGDIQKAGASAEAERRKIDDALKRIQQNLNGLGQVDLPGAATAGTNLVSSVGPFVVNCGGCSAALYGAIGQAAASIGSATAGTAACPETGGAGCLFGFPVSVVTGAGSALTAAVATAPCSAAVEGVGQMGEYVDNIKKVVDASVKLAQNFQKNVQDLQAAADALGQLAQKLPAQLKPRVDRIAGSIDKAGDALNSGVGILESDVAPRVEKLSTQLVTQLGTTTTDLVFCWNELTYAATLMGQDTVEALGLLAEASTNLVDGGQIVQNLQNQGADAVQAAGRAALAKWEDLDDKYVVVHRDLWGVSPGTTDLGRTIQNLPNLVTKIGKISSDLGAYANSLSRLVTTSVDAGKNAFLDRDRLKTQSKPKFDTAESKAKGAAIALAKAKMKANAKRQSAKQVPRVAVGFTELKGISLVKVRKINPGSFQFIR